jgi:hypothetical protein
MEQRSVTLLKARETAGTVVYTEPNPDRAKQTFPTIYVQKHAFPTGVFPSQITVKIEWEVQ